MFPSGRWENMSYIEKSYFESLEKDQLIERWNTEEGKNIKKRIIETNLRYGSSEEYIDFIGTIKNEVGKKPPKYDLRGIDFSDFSNTINDECFGFDFSNCKLEYSNFSYADFSCSKFRNSDILYSNFEYSILDECDFSGTNLTLSNFNNCILENGNLCRAWISDVSFKNSNLGYIKYDRKIDFLNINSGAFEGNSNPLFVDFIKRKQYLKNFKNHNLGNKIIYYIWLVISDCGQSFLRWLSWSIIISLLFGLLFTKYSDSFLVTKSRELTSFSFYYYSIVTFTTLGYGDITPNNILGEVLVTIEVVIGYIMLGGLLSIFSNKFIPKQH